MNHQLKSSVTCRKPSADALGRLPPFATDAHSRGALILRRFTQQHGTQPAQQAKQAQTVEPDIQQAYKELGPYLLWDKALKLRAVWDSRDTNKWQLSSAKAVLEQRALDSITLDTTQGSRGQELTTLTVVCKEEDGDQIAAALLQFTPTTHITATPCEQCYLPQHSVTVDTEYGKVRMHLSLAGSKVHKAIPDWSQLDQGKAPAAAAATAGDGPDGAGPDPSDVAAAAIKQLKAGLEDGSIELGTQYLY